MATINCTAELYAIRSWIICRLPERASASLPSRGMVAVAGTVNGCPYHDVLEPDGRGSHWFRVSTDMQQQCGGIGAGDRVTLVIEPCVRWPEPEVPEDVREALSASPVATAAWKDITPLARWDWIRWMRATNNPATRRQRIVKLCSMLQNGKRRPCCFNRNLCTDMTVAEKGVLPVPGPDG